MSSANKVIIVGRLGQDPEVRQFDNGNKVANLSIATSEKWTDKQTGEPKEQTEWHRVSLYNRLAEIAGQYLRKGSLVYIEGSLHTRKYTDNNGIERYVTEIKAQSMSMLGSPNNQNQQNGYQPQGQGFGQPQQGYQQNYQPPTQQQWQQMQQQSQVQQGFTDGYPNEFLQNNYQRG